MVRVDTSFAKRRAEELIAQLKASSERVDKEVQAMTDAEKQEFIRKSAEESAQISKRMIPGNSSDSSGGDA